MTDLNEIRTILGWNVKRLDGIYRISQEDHCNKIVEKFQFQNAHEVHSPITKGSLLHEYRKEEDKLGDQKWYRSAIGSLLYMATSTRPNLSFATSVMSRFLEESTKRHR
jgi:hypothetical protein